MIKRIALFILINFLVVFSVSCIINFFHLQPYISAYGLHYQSLLIFCFIWGMTGALISLLLSRQMAKWMAGVRLVSKEHELYAIVDRLAKAANLPATPQVGIFESPLPNAFATGPTKRRSLVAVSSSLLRVMTPSQLEAIIGHELAHIANGDMVTMTLLQGVINAFVMFFARILAFALSGLGRNQDSNKSQGGSYLSYALFTMLFEVVFMLLGSLVIAYYSRRREFRADYGGARLSSRYNMIGALKTLEDVSSQYKESRSAKPLEAFMINRPHQISRFFATHPPIEKRIAKLEESHDLF